MTVQHNRQTDNQTSEQVAEQASKQILVEWHVNEYTVMTRYPLGSFLERMSYFLVVTRVSTSEHLYI
jgi:hypothetical protein